MSTPNVTSVKLTVYILGFKRALGKEAAGEIDVPVLCTDVLYIWLAKICSTHFTT